MWIPRLRRRREAHMTPFRLEVGYACMREENTHDSIWLGGDVRLYGRKRHAQLYFVRGQDTLISASVTKGTCNSLRAHECILHTFVHACIHT